MEEPDWVTEDADAHLLPHIERTCTQNGWEIRRAEVVDAVLEVDVAVAGARREQHAAAYAILGSFAESATHVTQTNAVDRSWVELVVTTGTLAGDGPFAAHGHVVRLSVRET
jgi:hypothetical protein